MGFATAFVSSATLTSGILYLSVNIHQRNRAYQSALIRQQTAILDSIVHPPPAVAPAGAHQERASLVETAKDRWNSELENAVKRVQAIDWARVRETAEDKVARVWERAIQKGEAGVREIEKKA
ncbi:hypothetical protein L228DRAFT_244472 [Xylona heveae TC161]|uniref:MICOS complex subunit MIC12 n=1 Tax=Xylona heveae (strain CBS 132557 / TC161) TaxID=1328760 RepID=A0A165J013_XYLHT|nr:hypothetical protein L228DRAFT_244472 [Xylona heveae TC161]KZF25603.1 hypothetical protein L228DRAFT_244472 [Xylona heveae TC161]